jgi:hypothetical protein
MRVKKFRDGNRVVFVIEDCEAETEQKLDNFLNPEVVDALDAQPVEDKKEISQNNAKEVEAEKATTNKNNVDDQEKRYITNTIALIESGKVSTKTDQAFKYLSDVVAKNKETHSLENEQEICNALNTYIGKRFLDVDSYKASKSLSEEQCLTFADTFKAMLEKELKKLEPEKQYSFEDYAQFDIETKRKVVYMTIEKCKRIGKTLNKKS